MKFILVFILLFINQYMFGQDSILENESIIFMETNIPLSTALPNKKVKKKYQYLPHTIGLSTRFNGVGRFNLRGNSSHFLSLTTIDFYVGKRIGKTKYNSLIQFRLSDGTKDSLQPDIPFLDEFRWGLLLGGSQYLFDKRTDNGKGWSMLLNGGLSFDLPTISRIKKSPEYSILNIGIELDFKSIYNFTDKVAITFGLNMGYIFSYTQRYKPVYDGEGFPLPIPTGLYFEHGLIGGLTVGVLF
ncbi:MAG: hypothetical protein ACRCV0_05965 [Brevinema sp.]